MPACAPLKRASKLFQVEVSSGEAVVKSCWWSLSRPFVACSSDTRRFCQAWLRGKGVSAKPVAVRTRSRTHLSVSGNTKMRQAKPIPKAHPMGNIKIVASVYCANGNSGPCIEHGQEPSQNRQRPIHLPRHSSLAVRTHITAHDIQHDRPKDSKQFKFRILSLDDTHKVSCDDEKDAKDGCGADVEEIAFENGYLEFGLGVCGARDAGRGGGKERLGRRNCGEALRSNSPGLSPL